AYAVFLNQFYLVLLKVVSFFYGRTISIQTLIYSENHSGLSITISPSGKYIAVESSIYNTTSGKKEKENCHDDDFICFVRVVNFKDDDKILAFVSKTERKNISNQRVEAFGFSSGYKESMHILILERKNNSWVTTQDIKTDSTEWYKENLGIDSLSNGTTALINSNGSVYFWDKIGNQRTITFNFSDNYNLEHAKSLTVIHENLEPSIAISPDANSLAFLIPKQAPGYLLDNPDVCEQEIYILKLDGKSQAVPIKTIQSLNYYNDPKQKIIWNKAGILVKGLESNDSNLTTGVWKIQLDGKSTFIKTPEKIFFDADSNGNLVFFNESKVKSEKYVDNKNVIKNQISWLDENLIIVNEARKSLFFSLSDASIKQHVSNANIGLCQESLSLENINVTLLGNFREKIPVLTRSFKTNFKSEINNDELPFFDRVIAFEEFNDKLLIIVNSVFFHIEDKEFGAKNNVEFSWDNTSGNIYLVQISKADFERALGSSRGGFEWLRYATPLSILPSYPEKICVSKSGNYAAILLENGMIHIIEKKNNKEIIRMLVKDADDYVVFDTETFKFTGQGASITALSWLGRSSWIGTVSDKNPNTKNRKRKNRSPEDGFRPYGFDSFDLAYNRPDHILSLLSTSSDKESRINFLKSAVKQRFKSNGIPFVEKTGEINVPVIFIKGIPADGKVNVASLSLTIDLGDPIDEAKLIGYKIFVNGVPLGGDYIRTTDPTGKKISGNSHTFEQSIELAPGENKIEVSAFTEDGVESPREAFTVNYTPPTKRKPDLYFVGIGIDEYNASTSGGLDALQYAVKDSKELEDTFKKSGKTSFGNVFTKVIANKEVTQASIKNLREFLAKSKVDDHVILFLSGHGIRKDTKLSDLLIAFGDKIPEHYKLRDKSDVDDVYYYMTSEANVDKPWEKAIPLDGIRDLVNGILSRQKIMLVDTCQSGEKLDLDEQTVASLTKNVEIRKTRGQTAKTRGLNMITKPGASNEKPEDTEKKIIQSIAKSNALKEMSELFPELRRGTGTIEISAATGAQSALESKEWQNGAFTFVIKEAILKGKAKDKSGNITAQSLRRYVLDEVEKLTDGQQTPMVARDIAGRDFVIFGK
ncbi:MAG: caspase family protein, partial [Leptospiraceae bacterium]|nr:caspase family protein [Leptospiraceae bacterium]